MIDPIYSIVLSTAFLGSGHCIGMCGPVVAAFSLSSRGRRRGFVFHLFYNGGRITTYCIIGIAAGWIGSLLNTTETFSVVSRSILLLADFFIIAMGMATAGFFAKIRIMRLEFPGALQAMTSSVVRLQKLPVALSAFPIGMIMGFLPCGFLYAVALAAAGRGDPVEGGLIMLAFGLGTVPSLLLFGSTVQWLTTRARGEMLRWAGVMVVAMGCYNLYQHIRLMGLI
jgi:sulfite exporter TauE/SafE